MIIRVAPPATLSLLLLAGISSAANIQNDTFWKDTSGNNIYSQGGGMLQVGNLYYWYGVNYTGAARYAADPAFIPPAQNTGSTGFKSVTCYSSTDLAHWKFEGDALKPDQAGRGWFGRLGVAYNAKTKKYVLVAQGSSPPRPRRIFRHQRHTCRPVQIRRRTE